MTKETLELKEPEQDRAKASPGRTSQSAPVAGTPDPAPAPSAQQPAQPQLQLDDSKAIACYANFCRVTGTPEELIIDFALKPQPFGTPTEPIQISQRLIVNFYTAKRMLAALQMTLARHEGAFGVLEIDVQKRLLPAAMRQAGQC